MTTIEDGALSACMSRHPSASEYGRHALTTVPSDTQVYYGPGDWAERALTGQHRPEVRELITAGVLRDDLPRRLWAIATREMRGAV